MELMQIANHLQSRIIASVEAYAGTTEAELQAHLDDPELTTWSSEARVTAAQIIAAEADAIAATSVNILAASKKAKIDELKEEALVRFKAENDEIDSWGMVEIMKTLYLSIAPAARQPTAEMTALIAIHTAGKNAAGVIKSLDQAGIDAYDVKTDPNWP